MDEVLTVSANGDVSAIDVAGQGHAHVFFEATALVLIRDRIGRQVLARRVEFGPDADEREACEGRRQDVLLGLTVDDRGGRDNGVRLDQIVVELALLLGFSAMTR